MSESACCGKENRNPGNILLTQDTSRKQYHSKRSKKKTHGVTKINQKLVKEHCSPAGPLYKQDKNELKFKNSFSHSNQMKKDFKVRSSIDNTSSCKDKKIKLGRNNFKLQKRTPLAQVNTNHHPHIFKAKSKLTAEQSKSHTSQVPLKIPQTLRFKTSDLKLKSSLAKNVVSQQNNEGLKGNNSDIHFSCADSIKSFAFLESKFNKLHNLKKKTISRVDRETFAVFNFPSKTYIEKQNIPGMGSMQNTAVDYKTNSNLENLEPSSLKIESSIVYPDMNRKLVIEQSNSIVKSSEMAQNNVLSEQSFQTKNSSGTTEVKQCSLEESEFVSPVLGGMLSANRSALTSASPILDSKISKLKLPIIQSREGLLSPILNKNEISFKSETPNLNMKNPPSKVVNDESKPKECLMEKENHKNKPSSSQIVSPVLDSNKCSKRIFLQKLKSTSSKLHLKSKLDEEEFSSPVLGTSLSKKSCKKIKNLSVGENLKNSTSVISEDLSSVPDLRKNNSFVVGCEINDKELQPEVGRTFGGNFKLKDELSCKNIIPSLKECKSLGSLNNEYFIDRSKFNSHEVVSEPLPQVFGSYRQQNILPENINVTEIKTKSLQNTISDCVPLDSSHEELMEFCSPILDSSKFQKHFSVKETEVVTPTLQERLPKSSIQSADFKNCYRDFGSECLKTHDEKSSISMNLLPSSEDPRNYSLITSGNLLIDSDTGSSCDQAILVQIKSAEGCCPNSFNNQTKRTLSPIMDSKLKFRKQKSEIFTGGAAEHLRSMLGSVSKSQDFDNRLCANVSNLDQNETLIRSPSFNSELDIRKFPIMLPDIMEQCPFEKLDKNSVLVMSYEKCSKDGEGQHFVDKSSVLLTSSNLCAESLTNPPSHESERREPPTLSKNKVCTKSYSPKKSNKNNPANFHHWEKSETWIHNQPTGSAFKPNDYSKTNERSKRHVGLKKNLALYYEEVKQSDKISDNSCSVNVTINNSKDNDEGMLYDNQDQISGIRILQASSYEIPNGEKLLNSCQPQNYNKPENGNVSLDRGWVKPHALNKQTQGTNLLYKGLNIEQKQQSLWKNQIQLFEDNEDICIDDFDEESPFDKENVDFIVDGKKLDSVKRNLNHNFEQYSSRAIVTKPVPEVGSLLCNFESEDQKKNTCEYVSSEESSGDVEIQEDFSQKSERSPAFRIEYSTSPITKSSEGTQNEAGSNPPSFPPALDVEVNIALSAGVLDSACKNRRPRVKKGSCVERLRRLVRGQRAEVNMFHHEVSVPVRAQTRACSLLVTTATHMCSLVVLNCRYLDAQRPSSQEFGSGEEVVDPEVHVYVDPSYVKNIVAGCVVTVFPPWHSMWYESRGVVVMYCVTKIRLVNSTGRETSLLTKPSTGTCTTVLGFNCQLRDENCSCRSQLVGQLFTDSPQLQVGAVQPRCGADGAITAALAEGWYPHKVRLRLTILHIFQVRSHNNQIQSRVLCVDASGQICQLNLNSEQDLLKLETLKEANHRMMLIEKLTVCRRIFIDWCKGLRCFLTYLMADSTNQQMLYVATPSSDEWSVQLIEMSPDSDSSAHLLSRITCQQRELLSLPISEDIEGRARARVKVMAYRRDELYVWEPQLDSYFKLNITSSAAIPNFPARSCLDLLYLWAHHGELTIDRFTKVSIVEAEEGDSPTIPPFTVDSTEDSLALLDSIITKVSSEAYLRWEGSCGHKMLRVQKTGLYFCVTCKQTSSTCIQRVVLEVCVAVEEVPFPIRVKVKSETARVLLGDTSGQISSEKSYNMISVIGSTLKCLAVVSEVLRNSFGDIIEFILEEL